MTSRLRNKLSLKWNLFESNFNLKAFFDCEWHRLIYLTPWTEQLLYSRKCALLHVSLSHEVRTACLALFSLSCLLEVFQISSKEFPSLLFLDSVTLAPTKSPNQSFRVLVKWKISTLDRLWPFQTLICICILIIFFISYVNHVFHRKYEFLAWCHT